MLYKNITGYINTARSIYSTLLIENRLEPIGYGRDIVEEEQASKKRAGYGELLLQELSIRLTKEFGRGFSISTLKDIRQFYLVYSETPKSHAVRG